MTKDEHVTLRILALVVATFFLRIGFSASLILFDWTLVWAIENGLGMEKAFSFEAILMTSFAGITFLIAEIFFTGYYGNLSDRIGVKPVILFSTLAAAVVLAFYIPAPFVLVYAHNDIYIALLLMISYMALIHFLHGVVASANVSPSLGYINRHSTYHNRSLHMAWYDNAILYARAIGMAIGGLLWVYYGVDNVELNVFQEAERIALSFVSLSLFLLVSAAIIYFGIEHTPRNAERKPFSFKKDIGIAYHVMMDPKRRYMVIPWMSISALIGSFSLWGPSITFRVSNERGHERGLHALLPIMVIVIALALPAPFWGWFADHRGRKITLELGLLGIPLTALGALIGLPFYKDNLTISNPILLASVFPGLLFISALVPVLMGRLGDTAEKDKKGHGTVMSGYHFIIATGEILGILGGGLVIGFFALLAEVHILPDPNLALLIGFVLFELTLVVLIVQGILRMPKEKPPEEQELQEQTITPST